MRLEEARASGLLSFAAVRLWTGNTWGRPRKWSLDLCELFDVLVDNTPMKWIAPVLRVRVFARSAAGNAEAKMRSSKRDGELRRIRRRIAESWTDTPRKALALETLDRLIWEVYKASNDAA